METHSAATTGPMRRGLQWLKALFVCERAIPRDRTSHVSYLVILLLFLLVPFLVSLKPVSPRPLSLLGIPLPPGCPSRQLFNVECPGCGMTRSFVALTHGQWKLAWDYHRIGIVLYVYFAARVLAHAWFLVRPEAASHRVGEAVYNLTAWSMIVLLLGNWLFGICAGSNGG